MPPKPLPLSRSDRNKALQELSTPEMLGRFLRGDDQTPSPPPEQSPQDSVSKSDLMEIDGKFASVGSEPEFGTKDKPKETMDDIMFEIELNLTLTPVIALLTRPGLSTKQCEKAEDIIRRLMDQAVAHNSMIQLAKLSYYLAHAFMRRPDRQKYYSKIVTNFNRALDATGCHEVQWAKEWLHELKKRNPPVSESRPSTSSSAMPSEWNNFSDIASPRRKPTEEMDATELDKKEKKERIQQTYERAPSFDTYSGTDSVIDGDDRKTIFHALPRTSTTSGYTASEPSRSRPTSKQTDQDFDAGRQEARRVSFDLSAIDAEERATAAAHRRRRSDVAEMEEGHSPVKPSFQ